MCIRDRSLSSWSSLGLRAVLRLLVCLPLLSSPADLTTDLNVLPSYSGSSLGIFDLQFNNISDILKSDILPTSPDPNSVHIIVCTLRILLKYLRLLAISSTLLLSFFVQSAVESLNERFLRKLMFIFKDIIPVSYTHLDVYKRQVQERRKRGILCRG